MSTNVEIGNRLKTERQRVGMTQAALAEVVGVSKTSQVNYEAGVRMPDALYLAAANTAGLDALYILTGQHQGNPDGFDNTFSVIPLLGVSAAAGNGVVNDHHAEYSVSGLSFSREWLARRKLSPTHLRVIEVRGTSMEGVLSDGDRVLIDLQDTQPRSGIVYVIRQGDELLVKYCMLLPGGLLRMSSANPTYPAYDVDLSKSQDVSVIGRVVASMHEW